MAGIAGIIYPNAFQVSDLIDPMLRTLDHRGMGTQEVVTIKNVQLGTNGTDFFWNPKKKVYALVDGIICDARLMREKLKKKGFAFQGETYSELLLTAMDHWGEEYLQHIRGDFTFCIYNEAQGTLYLARDRIGKKPLYWYHGQNHFIFASELKTLLSTGIVPQTLATDAISSYLYFGFLAQDVTPVKDANKLLPGYLLTYHLDQSKSIDSFWSLSSFYAKNLELSPQAQLEEFNALLSYCVKERLRPGDKVGSFVSGGLGSAATAFYLNQYVPQGNLSAYTAGFLGQNDEDLYAATEVTTTLDLPHQTAVITPETFLQDLIPLVWYLDEPIGDPNIVATWRLAELASRDVDCTFSGMGSDELLAGHSRYALEQQRVTLLERILYEPILRTLKKMTPFLHSLHHGLGYRILRQQPIDLWQLEYLRQNALFNEATLELAAPQLSKLFNAEVYLHKFHGLDEIHSIIPSFLYLDIKTRMVDSFLAQYERLTAACQLRWYTPFLDQRLIEFLVSLPLPESKKNGETTRFLPEILSDVYPEHFIRRPKITRKYMLSDWAASESIYPILKQLQKSTIVEAGLVSREWLEGVTSNPSRACRSFRFLFALLILEVWIQLFINHPIHGRPPEITINDLLRWR